MTTVVKEYIQRNIDLIETDLYEFYRNLYTKLYNNGFVKRLTDVLEEAGIDTMQVRKDCLYDLFEEICKDVISGADDNLHRLLDDAPNWFGFTLIEVIDLFKDASFNLGFRLLPMSGSQERIFSEAPNYIIVEA